MKNVLLTGATGFLGNILIEKLFEEKYKIFVLARKEENIDTIKNKTEIIFTDYSLDSLNSVFPKNIDVVIHLAWAGVNGPQKGDVETQQNNIELALKIATVARENEIIKFIGIGTITELAYLDNQNNSSPSIIYGKYKYECYKRLSVFFKSTNIQFIWLRLANIYGSNNLSGNILGYTFQKLMNNQIAEFGPCNQYYDFVYVDDEIDAIVSFIQDIELINDNYFLGSGSPKLLKDYISTIGKIFNKEHLLQIGARQNDGIVFKKDIFDSSNAFTAIGNYISGSFENRIEQLKNELLKGN